MNDRLCSEDPCFFGLFISVRIKGALSLEIDEDYFINNIEDDGSYDWDAGDELYTKTITADNLDFSIDNDGKYQRKLRVNLNMFSDIILSHTIDTTPDPFSIGSSTIRLMLQIFKYFLSSRRPNKFLVF